MTNMSLILLTDENQHGEENINATSEKERLQSSNVRISDMHISKGTKAPVPDGMYFFIFSHYCIIIL
jgi:hypothetical protein